MKRFRNILYVTEPSVEQDATLARAASLARNNEARLTLLDIVPALPRPPEGVAGVPDRENLQEAFLNERREQLVAFAGKCGDARVAVDMRIGRMFFETIQPAKQLTST